MFQQDGYIFGRRFRAVQLAPRGVHFVELLRVAGGRKGYYSGMWRSSHVICNGQRFSSTLFSPPGLRKAQPKVSSICYAAVFKNLFLMTFVRPNYLNIYWTNLHPIRRYGRTMAANEKSEVSFWIPQRRGRGNQFSGHRRLESTHMLY